MGWAKCRVGDTEVVEEECSAADRVGLFACAEREKMFKCMC